MGSAPSSAAPEMPAMSGRCPPAALSSARDANVESTGTAGISPRWRTFLLHQADPTTPKRLVAGGVVVGQERCRPASRIPPTPRAGEPTRDRGTPPAGRRGAGRSSNPRARGGTGGSRGRRWWWPRGPPAAVGPRRPVEARVDLRPAAHVAPEGPQEHHVLAAGEQRLPRGAIPG